MTWPGKTAVRHQFVRQLRSVFDKLRHQLRQPLGPHLFAPEFLSLQLALQADDRPRNAGHDLLARRRAQTRQNNQVVEVRRRRTGFRDLANDFGHQLRVIVLLEPRRSERHGRREEAGASDHGRSHSSSVTSALGWRSSPRPPRYLVRLIPPDPEKVL